MMSFIHRGNHDVASFRYRARMPASQLNAQINNFSADILVYAKPQTYELEEARVLKAKGKIIGVDFCDDHFKTMAHYEEFARLANFIVCPTEAMKDILGFYGFNATVIPDAYEMPEKEPHCKGTNLLWFGHAVNLKSLKRVIHSLGMYDLRIVSNADGCIPWSHETMVSEWGKADIVILPATADYKSPNRALESIRSGCFVVAEEHPALRNFPVWKGNIREGIEWAASHLPEANEMTMKAQQWVRSYYAPRIQADAWKQLLDGVIPSVQARESGKDGPVLTSLTAN